MLALFYDFKQRLIIFRYFKKLKIDRKNKIAHSVLLSLLFPRSGSTQIRVFKRTNHWLEIPLALWLDLALPRIQKPKAAGMNLAAFGLWFP